MQPVGKPTRSAEEVEWTINFSNDGKIMATGGIYGTVELSVPRQRQAPIGQPMKGDGYVTGSIAFSHDGHLLAVGQPDYTLRLWDTGTFQPVGDPMPLDAKPSAAAFSPDGRTVAAGSRDGSIRLWDVGDQSLSAPLTGHDEGGGSLDFSPDGTKLLSASEDHTLRLWPLPHGIPQNTLCTKLTHTMTPEQWNGLVSEQIPYVEVCDGLTEGQ